MKIHYFKRLGGGGRVMQIWLELVEKEGIKLYPYTCECEYFGEGLGKEDLIAINLEEFRDLGWLFSCFSKQGEQEIVELGSVSN